MSAQNMVIGFVDCSSADANRYAQDLEGTLIEYPSLRVLGARDIRNQSFLVGLFLNLDW